MKTRLSEPQAVGNKFVRVPAPDRQLDVQQFFKNRPLDVPTELLEELRALETKANSLFLKLAEYGRDKVRGELAKRRADFENGATEPTSREALEKEFQAARESLKASIRATGKSAIPGVVQVLRLAAESLRKFSAAEEKRERGLAECAGISYAESESIQAFKHGAVMLQRSADRLQQRNDGFLGRPSALCMNLVALT